MLMQPQKVSAIDLTEEERAWIVMHPVVRMSVDPDWKPIEYLDNGQYKGISSEYIRQIEKRTGLRFEVSRRSDDGDLVQQLERREIDVLPAMLSSFTPSRLADLLSITHNYYVGITLVFTCKQGTSIFDLAKLKGQTVSIKGGSDYQKKIQSLYPSINIIDFRTSEEQLQAVVDGRAYAALGMGTALLPYVISKYEGVLHEAGVIGNLPMELAIGVRKDLPLLQSIINKALDSFTAKETDQIVASWYKSTDFGKPSFIIMLRYYSSQLALIVLSLLLISAFALQARRQYRCAVRSEKEKSMFIAVLSHEIRSPMNAILASMELLQQKEIPHADRRLLDLASNGADSILRLLDDVLDTSKLEAGRLQLDLSPIDVMELLRSVTELLMFKAKEKGIFLKLQEDCFIIHSLILDPLRVGQILHNLIANAVKFTSSGGVIINVGYNENLLRLRIVISDTGIGMDKATQQRLFQAYTQASASTARRFGGTGLGLLISKQLVELMNGSIVIHSELGCGTSIIIELPCEFHAPLQNGDMSTMTPLQNLRPNSSSLLSILLIEDTEANQAVLQAQLDILGCSHILAADGNSALKNLESNKFDIILLDCDLPDITGYQLAKYWRGRESDQRLIPTPIIAISASADSSHTAACFESGMDGVLNKPIKLAKLRDTLQLWSDVVLERDLKEVAINALGYSRNLAEEFTSDLRALKLANNRGDSIVSLHHAHRLVGAFEVLGAHELAASARIFENCLREGGSIGNSEFLVFEDALHNWVRSNMYH